MTFLDGATGRRIWRGRVQQRDAVGPHAAVGSRTVSSTVSSTVSAIALANMSVEGISRQFENLAHPDGRDVTKRRWLSPGRLPLPNLYALRIYVARILDHALAKARSDMDRPRAPESYLPLRPVEFHILLSLAAGERHGYGIIQDAEARGETAVPDVGTLYRALARMVDQRLIEPSTRRHAPDADGRRNYYRIRPHGLSVARAEAQRLAALTRAARAGGLLEKPAW